MTSRAIETAIAALHQSGRGKCAIQRDAIRISNRAKCKKGRQRPIGANSEDGAVAVRSAGGVVVRCAAITSPIVSVIFEWLQRRSSKCP